MNRGKFDSLRASSLYCRKCQAAQPVRERLLLILPSKEIFEYLCSNCGDSLGTREVSGAAPPVALSQPTQSGPGL